MPYYGESPLERIVDVHWKKKGDGEPPDDTYPPAYCGRYTFHSDCVAPNEFVVGPNPPFYGSFRTDGTTGSDGTKYGAISTSMLNPDQYRVITAPPFNLYAYTLVFNSNDITFTNLQLMGIPQAGPPLPDGSRRGCNWSVPMVSGYINRVPTAINSYRLECTWASVPILDPITGLPDIYSESQFGVGITRLGPGAPLREPREPFMQGSLVADALTFDYEFRWREWMRNEIPVNEGNMHDPHGGGPALFWAMINIFDPSTHNLRGWVVPTGAFTTGYGTVGSFFYWTVTAQCMQMPNIFG